MLHTSYCYAIAALDRFYHRHVLLFGAIAGVLLHQLHRLATATEHGSWVYNFYYIATNLAAVDFSNFCHNGSSYYFMNVLPEYQVFHSDDSFVRISFG